MRRVWRSAAVVALAVVVGLAVRPDGAWAQAHQHGQSGHDEASAHDGRSMHAGKETREIKARSAEDVAALLAGEGAGYALAAELNRYPGPRHVLDLRDALSLTASQVEAVEAIFETMQQRARELGRELVEAERELDRAFAEGAITASRLQSMTDSIGRLEAELRYVHLAAHLETRALLTAEQVRQYDRERGYRVEHVGAAGPAGEGDGDRDGVDGGAGADGGSGS
ncbi:MAG: Spy/CpxP family protein refolding chaperone [Gemmatimonadota bacterium]